MQRPKFSVIITNYNYGEYILDAIGSVLGQTCQDFELVVVDDGSDDDSVEKVKSFSDTRVVLVEKFNGGQASAFNAGFARSNGDIVCFLDSDDWWQADKLEVLDRWDELLGRRYSLLQHQMTVSDGEVEAPYKNVLPGGDCFAEMCKTGNIDFFVPTSGIAIPREVCERVFPIPEALRICADAYLTRTSFVFGPVVSIPFSLAYYRKHSNLVFQNRSFDHSEFFASTLFPALDAFYRANEVPSTRFSPEWSGGHPGNSQGTRTFTEKIAARLRRLLGQITTRG